MTVKYADIPFDLRSGIVRDLEQELGRKPSEDEVVRRYEDFALGRETTPIPERAKRDQSDTLADRLLRPIVAVPGYALMGVGKAVDWATTVPKSEEGVSREEALDRFLDGDPLTGRLKD